MNTQFENPVEHLASAQRAAMENEPPIRRAHVTHPDEAQAVEALHAQLAMADMAAVIFFCSDHYDPSRLAEQLNERFDCPVVGCTSAGEIGGDYGHNGIVGISLAASHFALHSLLIPDLDSMDPTRLVAQINGLERDFEFSSHFDPARMFALTLIDGLSLKEELVSSRLFGALHGLRMIGGSAGDSLQFKQTRVYADGGFHQHAAVLAIIETQLDFEIFKVQHFEPTEQELVITDCIPTRRVVKEIDGGPAAEEYAAMIGMDRQQLTPEVFSMYPLMLEVDDRWYVRSIEKANEDGSLSFFCAIDNGLPLTLGHGNGLVDNLEALSKRLEKQFSRIDLTLGCDCILRRLELQQTQDTPRAEALLRGIRFTGFSTFGEQYNGIHVNHTLVGVVLGEKAS